MKIVFASPRVPYPPNRGDRIRSYGQIHHLSRHHELHAVCFAERGEDWEGAAALRQSCASVSLLRLDRVAAAARCAKALATGGPLVAAYFGDPRLREAARAVAGADTDALWVCNGALFRGLADVTARHRVVDLVDVDSDKWRQLAATSRRPLAALYRREARLTREQEDDARRRADRCLVVSAAEAALLRSLQPALAPPAVIAAAVDLDYWPRTGIVAAPRLLFTGTLDYAPNEDAVRFFAAEVLPLLRRRLPAARLTVVGARPQARLRRCADRFGFELAGDVADVRPYFAAARVCVAPMRLGRGTQNKVLEAMASGVPVVATPLALAGLATSDEEIALRAESPYDLARACSDLLTDDDLAGRLAAAAHRFVASHHSRAVAAAALDRLLAELDTTSRAAAGAA
jgi:polysaccharide biosynthesis protein PslH